MINAQDGKSVPMQHGMWVIDSWRKAQAERSMRQKKGGISTSPRLRPADCAKARGQAPSIAIKRLQPMWEKIKAVLVNQEQRPLPRMMDALKCGCYIEEP